MCCGSWGIKGSDTTERLNRTELKADRVFASQINESLSHVDPN